MLENRLFQTVSTYTDGIALDSVASQEGMQFKDLYQATYVAFDLGTTGIHTQ